MPIDPSNAPQPVSTGPGQGGIVDDMSSWVDSFVDRARAEGKKLQQDPYGYAASAMQAVPEALGIHSALVGTSNEERAERMLKSQGGRFATGSDGGLLWPKLVEELNGQDAVAAAMAPAMGGIRTPEAALAEQFMLKHFGPEAERVAGKIGTGLRSGLTEVTPPGEAADLARKFAAEHYGLTSHLEAGQPLEGVQPVAAELTPEAERRLAEAFARKQFGPLAGREAQGITVVSSRPPVEDPAQVAAEAARYARWLHAQKDPQNVPTPGALEMILTQPAPHSELAQKSLPALSRGIEGGVITPEAPAFPATYEGRRAASLEQARAALEGREYQPAVEPRSQEAENQLANTFLANTEIARMRAPEQGNFSVSHRTEPNGLMVVEARDAQGNQIGRAYLEPGSRSIFPHMVEVSPFRQREGIGSAMYKYAENKTGLPMEPSGIQTEPGQGLWANPNRPFGHIQPPREAPPAPRSAEDFAATVESPMLESLRKQGKKYAAGGQAYAAGGQAYARGGTVIRGPFQGPTHGAVNHHSRCIAHGGSAPCDHPNCCATKLGLARGGRADGLYRYSHETCCGHHVVGPDGEPHEIGRDAPAEVLAALVHLPRMMAEGGKVTPAEAANARIEEQMRADPYGSAPLADQSAVGKRALEKLFAPSPGALDVRTGERAPLPSPPPGMGDVRSREVLNVRPGAVDPALAGRTAPEAAPGSAEQPPSYLDDPEAYRAWAARGAGTAGSVAPASFSGSSRSPAPGGGDRAPGEGGQLDVGAGYEQQIEAERKLGEVRASRSLAFADIDRRASEGYDEIRQQMKSDLGSSFAQADALARGLADETVDPNRLWNSAGTQGKVLAGIGMILGGVGGGLTRTSNAGLDMVNRMIDQDIDAQKFEVGKKQNLVRYWLDRGLRAVDAANAAAGMQKLVVAQQLAEAGDRFGAPEAQAAAQAAAGKLMTEGKLKLLDATGKLYENQLKGIEVWRQRQLQSIEAPIYNQMQGNGPSAGGGKPAGDLPPLDALNRLAAVSPNSPAGQLAGNAVEYTDSQGQVRTRVVPPGTAGSLRPRIAQYETTKRNLDALDKISGEAGLKSYITSQLAQSLPLEAAGEVAGFLVGGFASKIAAKAGKGMAEAVKDIAEMTTEAGWHGPEESKVAVAHAKEAIKRWGLTSAGGKIPDAVAKGLGTVLGARGGNEISRILSSYTSDLQAKWDTARAGLAAYDPKLANVDVGELWQDKFNNGARIKELRATVDRAEGADLKSNGLPY